MKKTKKTQKTKKVFKVIKYLTLSKAAQRAKKIKPDWIAVNSDGHIYGYIDKPKINENLGCWLSVHRSWNLGFYKKRKEWKNTLRRINYG